MVKKAATYQKSAYQKKKEKMVADSGKKRKYDYPGAGRRYGSMAGAALGNAFYPGIGGPIGAALGGVAGKGAHALVKRITGFGDYTVSKNALVYNRDAVPEFSSNNERCTMIVHREFISDIIGSTEFNINTYRINPGVDSTFPWLAGIAENYEQYVIQGMIFEFKTTCATAVSSTNTALGTVVLATQYNSLSPVFTSKQQMENYEFAQSSVPSMSVLHAIECDPTQTQCGGIFNVSTQATEGSGDIRLYDIGKFSIATVGMQAAATIGELWVSYKICFLKPRLQSSSECTDIYYQHVPGDVSATMPFGPYASLLPRYTQNSGVVTPISDSDFDVDINFVGVIQATIVYEIASTVTSFVTGYWTVAGGSGSTDVTYFFTDITPSSKMATPLTTTGNDVVAVTGFFRFEGGVSTPGGLTPYLTLNNVTIAGGGCNKVRIIFNSIDSSFYEASA